FEKIIISAYAWLADHYQAGDRIFLFGFSRGAYQVRALSAMIDILGLIHKGNDDQIPFAYELYAAGQELPSEDSTLPSGEGAQMPAPNTGADVRGMQKRFKLAFAREARVHFVGVWDTVSSVGIARTKTLPGTTDGMGHTCFFRHALAIHECRVKFLPEYVNGGCKGLYQTLRGCLPDSMILIGAVHGALSAGDGSLSAETGGISAERGWVGPPRGPNGSQAAQNHRPRSKEVWFSGSHSDIGGGATKNPNLDHFGPSLRWMSFEARVAGVRFMQEPQLYVAVELERTQSLKHFWHLLEMLPFKRLTYQTADRTTRM
ncbi:hypothetical protein AURDEDRAFT_62168, partial [Auricularia subglabra TFB-10046 SS5]